MVDTLFADISEWQPMLDPAVYPYKWLSLRSNDGTYRDRHWRDNWEQTRSMLDSGRLAGAIVYFVWRPDWRDTIGTHMQMIGEDRPDIVSMIDVESWGGQIRGDHSDAINRAVWAVGDWHGAPIDGRPRRVIGYFNPVADAQIWQIRAPVGFVVPSYGALPRFPAGAEDVRQHMIAHQYTDGSGWNSAEGLPQGYGAIRCDMNSADGLSPADLRVVTGIDRAGCAA